jgi:hypothetical protein
MLWLRRRRRSQRSGSAPRTILTKRTIPLDIFQGLLIGFGVSLLVIAALIGVRTSTLMTTVNGWQSTQACGVPSDLITQAACAQTLPAINPPSEAMYWQATVDGSGGKLDGSKSYVIRFPKGDLPPVNAFWSTTIAGANRLMVANSAHTYAVSDRSGLVANADGSIDVYVQPSSPNGHESNWLPTPSGNFMLWLRAYEPAPSILDGTWQPPAIQVAR